MQTAPTQGGVQDLEALVRDFHASIGERDWDKFRAMLDDDVQELDERRGVWFRGNPDPLVAGQRAEIEAAEAYLERSSLTGRPRAGESRSSTRWRGRAIRRRNRGLTQHPGRYRHAPGLRLR